MRLSKLKLTLLLLLSIFIFNLNALCQDSDEMSQETDEMEETEMDEAEMEIPAIELQDPISLLVDRNGDEIVTVAAFGDSITRGVGDFTSGFNQPLTFPNGEAGYPLRVEQLLGVPVSNLGIPGERFTTQGIFRFVNEVQFREPDLITLAGGSNDAIDFISVSELGRAIQTAINIAREVGSLPVLLTTPPVCCDHSGFAAIINSYNTEWRTRAAVNELPLVDIEKAYKNSCSVSSCRLLNLPEGLHPNTDGYDISGEMVAASLLGIALLEPNGPATLEVVLGLVPGTVKTAPNPNFTLVPEES